MKSRLRSIFAMTVVTGGKVTGLSRSNSRIRMMLRHRWLVSVAVGLLMAGLVGGALYVTSRPTVLRIAVGPAGSEDARLIQAMAQHFAHDRAGILLKPVVREGAGASAKALDDNEADLAVVRRDVAMPKNGLAVAVLRKNVAVLIVPAAGSPARGGAKKPAAGAAKPKKIARIDDIKGRRVGVVGRNNANVDVLNAILKQYEIPLDRITLVSLESENVSGSLRDNPVDVIFAAGPVTAKGIADAIAAASTAKAGPTFLAIGSSEAIENRQPVYESTEIKKGVFGGHDPQPSDDVETIGFSHYIMARKTLSDSHVGDFTKLLFAARQGLAAEFPGAAKIEKPDTDKDAAVAAHPGAAAYLDDDQKTFFDRYDDFLYWGLMLMSFLGSGIAWLTSYTRADERMRRMRVLDHLLDVMQRARAAQTREELDKLRADVDDVLRRTIARVERNELDESALMAFSLALDQAQIAIADQRAHLSGRLADEAAAEVTPLRIATP
jgi:TRAP transporter TAXI family solute receptor